ncbi:hypothetical protein GCM10011390_21300 [Aureimonas endophytica]|uniref:Uncharacterized protein n=1 Tax=Aureimonas endophytica TaxID=2027858 RepID=A0A916ZLD2_9HYPH|nr:hypothetical protein GCM10011390_21300 [Aureimonas endophytica]
MTLQHANGLVSVARLIGREASVLAKVNGFGAHKGVILDDEDCVTLGIEGLAHGLRSVSQARHAGRAGAPVRVKRMPAGSKSM